MPDQESLLDLVFDKLASDDVPAETAGLVLAAYAGEEQLAVALAGAEPDLPAPSERGALPRASLFLDSVAVAGFRGVGGRASLRLTGRPGLTLVVGRNGSGKSSFAEAAELSLTGKSARLSGQSISRAGWRNLHDSSSCQIQVAIRADNTVAPIQITRTWRDTDTDPDQGTCSVIDGANRYQDLAELGWLDALETYRPFLSAHDFGRLMSAAPSELFDTLAPILGLEPITAADKRLMHARKVIDDRLRELKDARDGLRSQLATVDDDRARKAVTILAKRRPSLDELDALLASTGETAADPAVAACQRLAAAVVPGTAEAAALATALDTAAHQSAALTASSSHAAHQVSQMLDIALAFHADQGDGPCPVCRTGELTEPWRAQTAEMLARLRAGSSDAREASTGLSRAITEARTFLDSATRALPGDLEPATTALGQPLADLREELRKWRATGQDATQQQVAEQLRSGYPRLHAALAAARAAAAEWLQGRHDAWREHAAAVQHWLGAARRASQDESASARIKAARDWLKSAAEEIRSARLAPFAQRSQEIWERLRQESNVELDGMRLDGSSTRRRLAFPATVDGTATQAMAVMSEGELQALGLAVFLPRASADDSPFRFLLIDDPVHSMDPSKVDGLAQVLADLARTRQVIVFTHDDRLPEAIRRLQIDATIWEVMRRERSIVELRKNLDPVRRYLDDARSLAMTADLAEDVRRPVVAGFCRSAIEAACHEHIRRVRLRSGESHASVDALIDGAGNLNQIVALALFGDASRGGEVLAVLNRRFGSWAADALNACKDNVHGSARGSLESLVNDTKRLTGSLG
jgi:DNA repair exonuclease SbcCD ATPase subunit